MKITRMRLIFVISILWLAALACNFPNTSGPSLPPTAQPMSTQDVQQFENNLRATLSSPNGNGDVTITLTQQEVNSIITTEMANQSNQILTDPSVVLTGGHMEMYGKVSQSGISVNSKVVLQPAVANDGTVSLEVVSINLGGVPVPDALKSQLQTTLNNALVDYLATNSNGFLVKTISIGEGTMTVTGSPR